LPVDTGFSKHRVQPYLVKTVYCNCLRYLTQCTALFTCVNNNKVSESDKASGFGRGIRRHLNIVENNPYSKYDNVRITMVPLKALTDEA